MNSKKNRTQAGHKILVVDDSQPVVKMIVKILENDYEIRAALSGKEALSVMEEFHPDLVLLDVMMEGMDGYEVCRRIRSGKKYPSTKIIMVSSGTVLKERIKGYNAGADDYICKPFNKEEFLAKVRVFLRLKMMEDQLHELNETLNEQVSVRTRQLLDSEKMAEIGRYAAGIVHNLKNPLQVIMGEAQLFAMKHPESENIKALRKAAAQMKEIIGTILTTSHKRSKPVVESIDLNEILREQVELLKANPFFKYNVKIVMNTSPTPRLKCVYSHFSQIIGNLIVNAVESMYESEKKVLTLSSGKKNNMIFICIEDTGCGIPQNDLHQIFDPFFTTKPLTATDGRPTGTGLGLASSKEMIESYGGKITVKSEENKGTVFTLTLPVQ